MLQAALGIDLIHMPYKGHPPALNDLLGGQVTVMFGNWPEFRGHVRVGKLAALGIATAQRSKAAPALPTLTEQRPTLESNSWRRVLLRRRTPEAVLRRLAAEIHWALAAPAVVQAVDDG